MPVPTSRIFFRSNIFRCAVCWSRVGDLAVVKRPWAMDVTLADFEGGFLCTAGPRQVRRE